MKALVLWFTGRSGSGKTTIADLVCDSLRKQGKKVHVLDGDVVRKTIHKNLTFAPEVRKVLIISRVSLPASCP